MNEQELENLKSHAVNISHALIQQLDKDGVILVSELENSATPDIVSTYHLFDLLSKTDAYLFNPILEAIAGWMINPKNHSIESPFTVDALSVLKKGDEEVSKLIEHKIVSSAQPNGGISAYTGYLRGGDYFSTLWCLKALISFGDDRYFECVSRGIQFLLDNRESAFSDFKKGLPSHLGFLGYILIKYDAKKYTSEIDDIFGFILRELPNVEDSLGKYTLTDIFFVLEDIFEYHSLSGNKDALELIDNFIVYIFDLGSEADGLPGELKNAQEKYPESLFYQALARATILANAICKQSNITDIASDIHRAIFDEYRVARYEAIKNHTQLKAFLERYGQIHNNFQKHNVSLEKAWMQAPFEKTIFIMMPFTDDLNHQVLADEIKRVCESKGYKAVRVDDQDRRFSNRLWDNLEINMLSAKFAISVYITDKHFDAISEERKLFSNPNVALEFGWFQSRGQNVLILKDRLSNLPSDLQGFIWDEFDIKKPNKTIESPVLKWINKIETD